MSSQGSMFNRHMNSEDMQSQDSNRSELLVSNSNMISEFNSSANATNSTAPSKITKLDFANIKQHQQQQQKQPNDGYKPPSNAMSIEVTNPETDKSLTPEFKK